MNTFPQPLDARAQDDHRWRNTVHTWLMIGGSALLMGVIAWLIFGASGIVWASLLTGFGLWQASRISPAVVLKLYKARQLTAHEVPQLTAIIDELAARANLPATPKLYYVPSQMMNAFAVGKPEDSAVAVTDALIRNLNLRQINGVLAHEVSHIRNGDLKVMALADTLSRLTGSISTFGLLFGMPALFLTGAGPASWLAVLFILAAPTIGGLLQLALSRTREYDADLDAAGLTGDPEGLASALQVLEQKQAGMWEKLTLPGARMPDPSLLRSHPRTEDRVARLLSLRSQARPATVHPDTPHKPGVSIVPPVRRPRIHASRLGVWY